MKKLVNILNIYIDISFTNSICIDEENVFKEVVNS